MKIAETLIGKIKFTGHKNAAVGLDIGKDSIKLVELRREGETIKLSKIDSAKIPPAPTTGSGPTQVIKKVIIGLFAKNQVKNKNVILGVNGQSVFIKFLDILPMSAEKVEQTIKYEAQQQIPFSLEEVEWDAHLLEGAEVEQSSSSRVLLVAIKKDKLVSIRTLAELVNLHPSILDVSNLSIFHCVRFNQDCEESKVSVVLNIGAQSTDLLILKGNNLWMRSFTIAGDNITAALAKKMNLSFAEAEKRKIHSNLNSPEVKEAIGPVLEDLHGEIARSIEYYYFQQKQTFPQEGAGGPGELPESTSAAQGPAEGQNPAKDETSNETNRVDEILLSGGTAQMAGLDKFLREKFSCAVRVVEPFKMLHLDPEMTKRLDVQKQVLFPPAVGLALRGLSESCVNINLFKEQIREKALGRQKLAYGVGSVVLALLILVGASTFMRQDYREKSSRLQQLKALLSTFSTHQPEIRDLQKGKELYTKRVNVLRDLAQNRAIWLEVLSEIEKMLPDDLWITEFTGTISFADSAETFENKLDLQGKAASYEDVNRFVSQLKSSTLFSEVKPLSSAFIEEQAQGKTEQAQEKLELVTFSIKMKALPITY